MLHYILVLFTYERDGCPDLTSATGSPDSVHIVLDGTRHIIVKDNLNTFDVQPSCCYVCSYKNRDVSTTEAL